MTLFYVPGRGILDDGVETIPAFGRYDIPAGQPGSDITWGIEGTAPIATYTNRAQYGGTGFQWDPQRQAWSGGIEATSPGYLTELFGLQDRVRAGQAQPYEADWLTQQLEQARAIPTRDSAALTAGWQGDFAGDNANPDWWSLLDPGSPDAGPIMLELRDKMDRGQATEQERGLYQQVLGMAGDWAYRASVPQASDASAFGLGDNLFGALAILGMAASAGTAAPLFAGGAGLGGTLGGIGSLAGTASTLTGMAGEALRIPELSKASSVLGALGGLAGGAGGIANLWGTGVQSLSDAARLAQSAGKITGSLGRLSGVEPLQQAAKYLGYAGQAGNLASGVLPTSFTDWSGDNSPLAQNVAPGVQGLLSAATQATQRGGGSMSEGDWLDFETDDWWRGGADVSANYSSGYDAPIGPGLGWDAGGYPTGDTGGGGNWWSSLGGLASGALGFLGKNAATLGPLVSAIGGGVAANVGSGAARDAGRLQADALNRGIDLQTAQWLQQQANQAPWMEAGRGALGELTWRQGVEEALPMPGAMSAISGANYTLPGTTPGWTPQNFDAGAYRWSPGQGPSAANYRYMPGATPDAAAYASGPPQLYQGAMPGTQVPTLTGQQVLDQDPGAAFRQTEARKALEGSAAARGGLLSGSTLGALQRQSQDLASQEYQNAWQRMMGRDVEQYGRNWGQYQQAWNQGVQGTQLGLQTNAQNFGQAMSAAQLREQVQQVAMQQGWSQAQAEAVFREQMAQASSQQGFQQGMAGTQWNQQQQQQWQQEQYQRMMQDVQTRYGWDVNQNQTDYQREQQAYQQRLAEQQRQWNQAASLAGLGQTATTQGGNQGAYSTEALGKMYGMLGAAQGQGTVGGAYPWTQAIGTGTNALTNLFKGLNA